MLPVFTLTKGMPHLIVCQPWTMPKAPLALFYPLFWIRIKSDKIWFWLDQRWSLSLIGFDPVKPSFSQTLALSPLDASYLNRGALECKKVFDNLLLGMGSLGWHEKIQRRKRERFSPLQVFFLLHLVFFLLEIVLERSCSTIKKIFSIRELAPWRE